MISLRAPQQKRVSFASGLFCLLASSVALASDPEVPKGVGPLPDFSKGAKAGAVVSAEHIQNYRGVLPREVADLVEQGEFAFEAVRSPREPQRFIRAVAPQPGQIDLTSDGEVRGLPASKLPSPVFAVSEYAGGDPKPFVYRVLWNVAAAMWRYPLHATELSAYIFPQAGVAPHKLEFEVARIHPRSLGGAPGSLEPIFREKISARKPSAIQSLAWLTLRFFGPGEDFVWVASPVIRRIRPMTSSNRSDQIFTGMFTPDDLFLWSGKVELVEPLSVTQLPMLVPLLEAREAPAAKQDSCTVRTFNSDSAVALNHQSRRFKSAAGWIPTNTIMALRSVWRVEFSSRDPFSNESRSTLYVDKDTGLPVYRVVWDSSGRLRKVVIGIVRSLETGEGDTEPFLAGQVIVFGNEGRRLVLLSDRFTECQQYIPGRTLRDFDPARFVTFPPDPKEGKRVEQPVDSEDSLD